MSSFGGALQALILAYWPLEAGSNEITELLTDEHPQNGEVFSTTKRARDPSVWGTKNLIVDFDASAIIQAMNAIADREGKPAVLIPEAYMCLLRGLEIAGKPTAGLEDLLSPNI